MINDEQVNKIVSSLESITVAHMLLPIDINRLILNDYPNAERDLCIYLVQGYYKKFEENAGRPLRSSEKERALIYAKYDATRRLTTELKGLIDRSTLYILVDAQTTGWHQAMEYDNIVELLSSILEGKEGLEEAYDWKFIVEKLIPAACAAQIPVNVVVNASLNVKKLRGMVPAARELLSKQELEQITPEEAKETLHDWLTKTASPTVSYAEFHEELNGWRNKSARQKEIIQGYKFIMPDGKSMMVIPLDSDRDMTMIEQALKNRVEFHLTGFDWIQNQVLPQTKEQRLQHLINV